MEYHNLDRMLQAGEVVRLDLGCDFQMYKADFGRTTPVSGHFDEAQRETMELLNGAYRAGVEALRLGGTSKDVFAATLAYIEKYQNELKAATAKDAAADALKRKGYALHGLGIDMAEGAPKTFQTRNVLCYEPQLTAGNQAFFVADTFLITTEGHPPEVSSRTRRCASTQIPEDIERAMNTGSPNV